MSKYLYVPGWQSNFERAQARRFDRLPWITQSTNLAHDLYLSMWQNENGSPRKDGPATYGIYRAILSLAAVCKPRGVLLLQNGTPHTISTIALRISATQKATGAAIARLTENTVGLLRWADTISEALAGIVDNSSDVASDARSDARSYSASHPRSHSGYDARQDKTSKDKRIELAHAQSQLQPNPDEEPFRFVQRAFVEVGVEDDVAIRLSAKPWLTTDVAGELSAMCQNAKPENPTGWMIARLRERGLIPKGAKI